MTVIEGRHDQLSYGVWPALTLRCKFSWRSTLHGERGGLLRARIIQQETNHSPLKCKCLPSRQGQGHCPWALETSPRFLPRKPSRETHFWQLTPHCSGPHSIPWAVSHVGSVGAVSRQTRPRPLWDSAATATPWPGLQLLRVAVTAESVWCPSDAEAENTLKTSVLCTAGLSSYLVSSSCFPLSKVEGWILLMSSLGSWQPTFVVTLKLYTIKNGNLALSGKTCRIFSTGINQSEPALKVGLKQVPAAGVGLTLSLLDCRSWGATRMVGRIRQGQGIGQLWLKCVIIVTTDRAN